MDFASLHFLSLIFVGYVLYNHNSFIAYIGAGAGGVLKAFLNAEDLRYMQHLSDILSVQSTLIAK